MAQFGLALHSEKTWLIEFGRFASTNWQRRGEGKPETFDLLGFTHYCGNSRKGWFKILPPALIPVAIKPAAIPTEVLQLRCRDTHVLELPMSISPRWLGELLSCLG